MIPIAALLVLALGVGVWKYQMFFPENSALEVSATFLPGEYKAQLTLGNGQVVPVYNKELSFLEENGSLVKYKGGHLTYQTENKTPELVFNTLEVPLGGECSVTLEDGTRVWVNADSKLKYPVAFTDSIREVYLEGEAYFDVVPASQTFVVHTSFGKVKVLGTAFGVTAYRGENYCYTTLERGRVSFETAGHLPLLIHPGEQVIASATGEMEKRIVDPQEYLGWRYGLYVFKEKPLKEIMVTLGRWYDLTVVFESEELKELPFTGNLERYDRIDIFLNALERTGLMKYRIEGKQVILFK